MARNSSSTGNGTDTTTGTAGGATTPDATTAPAAGGGTLPWFEKDTRYKPPPMDRGRVLTFRGGLLGGGKQLGLATFMDQKMRDLLQIIRRDFDPKVNAELLSSWAQDPKLVPPGTDAADLKQQIDDCVLIAATEKDCRTLLGWIVDTRLIREATVTQEVKPATTYALSQVDAEIASGGQSTDAIGATTSLRAELDRQQTDAEKAKKDRQNAQMRGSQNLDEVLAQNEALQKDRDALAQRVKELELAIPQSGGSLPPATANQSAGHKPAAHKPARRTGSGAGKAKPAPRTSGPAAAGRRKQGR